MVKCDGRQPAPVIFWRHSASTVGQNWPQPQHLTPGTSMTYRLLVILRSEGTKINIYEIKTNKQTNKNITKYFLLKEL